MRTTVKMLGLLYCVVVLSSLPAQAAADCSISTAGVAFGAYDALSGNRRDTIGTVIVTCTGNVGDSVSYSISLDTTGDQGAYRIMTNGTHQLNYFIFTDNGYSQVWGDGSGGTIIVSDSYTMATGQTVHSYPMYGRIPASQTRTSSGTYGGDITVTLIY